MPSAASARLCRSETIILGRSQDPGLGSQSENIAVTADIRTVLGAVSRELINSQCTGQPRRQAMFIDQQIPNKIF